METSGSRKYENDREKPALKKVRVADDGFEEERRPQRNEDKNRNVEESHFLRLYTMILNCIIIIKDVPEMDIMINIGPMIAFFKHNQYSKIDFANWASACGYLYRYGSHGAGFARSRILNALKNCNELMALQQTRDLRVVCLGTGPGNDAVGLCSALYEFQALENLTVTAVDKFKEWSLCLELAKLLIREGNFGKVSELFEKSNVDLSFIQVDLPGNLNSDKKYFQKLREADIILISKLLTGLGARKEKDIIESLKENMKKEALIFLNDHFVPSHWKAFQVLYTWGADAKDEYKSSAVAKERFGSNDRISSKIPISVLILKN